jgi:hypothetical protein
MNQMFKFLFTTRNIFLSGAMLLFFHFSYAQRPEAEIERHVKDFAKAYENIIKTRDKESVLKYVSKDLFSTIVKSNVVDNFGLIQSTYGDFESYLDRILRSEGMAVTYSVKDILRSRVRGRTGVVVAEISVQISSRGEVWNKGTELTTFTLKNFKDGWKILHFNVVSLEEEQNKGTCLTEFFSATSGNYVVKTIVPKGASYETNLNTFEFSKGSGITYINLDNESTYSWVREGPVVQLSQGETPEKTLGVAVDEMEAVLVIIEQGLYVENCTDFRRKR